MNQFLRYVCVGLLATTVHFAVVVMMVEMGRLDVLIANSLAWAAALGVSYMGHRQWTFSARGSHGDHLPRYVVVSLTGLCLNLATVWLLHHWLGAHYLVATTLGVSLSVFVTFIMSRLWAFVPSAPTE